MVNLESKRLEDILKLAIGLVIIVLANVASSRYFDRFDLTEEGRYSIKAPTKKILKNLDDVVFVEVYLDGELNSGFKRLRRSIRETLEEFRAYGGSNVQYVFNDPSGAMGQQAKTDFMRSLMDRGIQPTNIIDNKNGQRTERLVFPGAIVSYGGVEKGVMLLRGNQASSAEEKLNQSIENVEFELASAIKSLTQVERKSVGIIKGHGELSDLEMASFVTTIGENYAVNSAYLDKIPSQFDALILVKPTQSFSEKEKYNLDQYLMQGGSVLMLLDKLQANMDSASYEHNYALSFDLNLDDQLFKYGIRVNSSLIQDNSSGVYPVVMGNMGDEPQVNVVRWPFFPLINRFSDHAITHNLDAVLGKFVSSVDTVAASGVKKTPLLFTSNYSRAVDAPVKVSIQDLRRNLNPEMLNEPHIPIAWLLEGKFTSVYKNRFKPETVNDSEFMATASASAKLIVVGDGDMARNDVNPKTGNPQPLGFDPFMDNTFANQEFLMNALAYLTEEDGLILARNKEIKIRPLDKVKIADEKLKWQIINLVLPIVALILFGVFRYWLRKRKYTGFDTK